MPASLDCAYWWTAVGYAYLLNTALVLLISIIALLPWHLVSTKSNAYVHLNRAWLLGNYINYNTVSMLPRLVWSKCLRFILITSPTYVFPEWITCSFNYHSWNYCLGVLLTWAAHLSWREVVVCMIFYCPTFLIIYVFFISSHVQWCASAFTHLWCLLTLLNRRLEKWEYFSETQW